VNEVKAEGGGMTVRGMEHRGALEAPASCRSSSSSFARFFRVFGSDWISLRLFVNRSYRRRPLMAA
jgi:hypothetical protein